MSEPTTPPPVPAGTPSGSGPSAGGPYVPYTGGPAAGGPASGGPSTGGPSTGYTGGPYTGGPYTGGPSGEPSAGSGFFDSIRAQALVRPDNRVAAGVAAAVAGKLGIDPLLVRVGFVVLAVLGGVGVLLYGLGWLLLPQQDGRIHAQALLRGSVTAGTVGAGLAIVLGIGGFSPPWGWDGDFQVGPLIGLASIVLVIVIFVVGAQQGWFGDSARAGLGGAPATPGPLGAQPPQGPAAAQGWTAAGASTVNLSKTGATAWPPSSTLPPTAPPAGTVPPPPPVPPMPPTPSVPPKPSAPRRPAPGALGTLLAVGLALVAAGAVVLADDLSPLSVDVPVVAWASALAVLAACLLAVGLAGRRAGGIAFFAIVALVGTTATSINAAGFEDRDTGQRRWAPTGDAQSYTYRLGAGEAELDLSAIRPGRSAPVDVEVDVSVGQLTLLVPNDLTVDLEVTHGVGEVRGISEGTSTLGPAGTPDVVLDADLSVGDLVLQEVSR